ncbi:MAG: hypothetical protein COW27_04405 [Nitrosopumilales archaeon CG15_BIG_FIL_POST_REV_8_21_14_020_37_12]|nr:MAG: hypothetical protein COW27_04405 [Nitrosopumilales archaeon CG15_BIG_FIL_POST_REV_8_21_14_020_37_12]
MIIGNVDKDEKRKKFTLEIICSNCKAKVPGRMQTSEKYYGTTSFIKEVAYFKRNYLCGRCRDKKRIAKKRSPTKTTLDK